MWQHRRRRRRSPPPPSSAAGTTATSTARSFARATRSPASLAAPSADADLPRSAADPLNLVNLLVERATAARSAAAAAHERACLLEDREGGRRSTSKAASAVPVPRLAESSPPRPPYAMPPSPRSPSTSPRAAAAVSPAMVSAAAAAAVLAAAGTGESHGGGDQRNHHHHQQQHHLSRPVTLSPPASPARERANLARLSDHDKGEDGDGDVIDDNVSERSASVVSASDVARVSGRGGGENTGATAPDASAVCQQATGSPPGAGAAIAGSDDSEEEQETTRRPAAEEEEEEEEEEASKKKGDSAAASLHSLVERVSLSADASSAGAGRAVPAFGMEEGTGEVGETETRVAAVDDGDAAAATAAAAADTASFAACNDDDQGGDFPLLPLALDGEAISLHVTALLDARAAGGRPSNNFSSLSSLLPADLVRALEDAAAEALALPQVETASHAEAASRVRRWVEHGSRHGGDVAASITAALAEEAAEDERRWQRETAA